MRAHNNGNASVCALNLLKIVRGEVAYERTKGIDTKYIDQMAINAATLSTVDAQHQLKVFEPRIKVDSYAALADMDREGNVSNAFILSHKEGYR